MQIVLQSRGHVPGPCWTEEGTGWLRGRQGWADRANRTGGDNYSHHREDQRVVTYGLLLIQSLQVPKSDLFSPICHEAHSDGGLRMTV